MALFLQVFVSMTLHIFNSRLLPRRRQLLALVASSSAIGLAEASFSGMALAQTAKPKVAGIYYGQWPGLDLRGFALLSTSAVDILPALKDGDSQYRY